MTGQSRGIALVQFEVPEEAVAAMQALDGSIFQGRLLHLLPARLPPQAAEPEPRQVSCSAHRRLIGHYWAFATAGTSLEQCCSVACITVALAVVAASVDEWRMGVE